MFCPSCGAQNSDNARFCTRCGTPLVKPVERINVPPAPQPAPPQQPAAPAPQPAPARKRPKTGVIIGIAAACTLALVIGVVAILHGTGIIGSIGGPTASTATRLAPFNSTKAIGITKVAKIVPSTAANKPMERYVARIVDAKSDDGSAIDVFSFPKLTIEDTNGFTMGEFGDGIKNGTYTVRVVNGDGTANNLPPVHVGDGAADGSSDAGNAGDSGDGAGKDSGDTLVVVPPDDPDLPEDQRDDRAPATAPKGRMAAYLKVLKDLEAKYGEPTTNKVDRGWPQWSYATGLSFAQLVDFGEGQQQLVVAYCTDTPEELEKARNSRMGMTALSYTIEIYDYDEASDSAISVAKPPVSSYEGGGNFFAITKSKDGKRSYVRFYGLAAERDSEVSYTGLKDDGSFGIVKAHPMGPLMSPDTAQDADINQQGTAWGLFGSEDNPEDFGDVAVHTPEESVQTAKDLIAKLEDLTSDDADAPSQDAESQADGKKQDDKAAAKVATTPTDAGYFTFDMPNSWQGHAKPTAQGHTSGAYHVDFYFDGDWGSMFWRVDGMANADGSTSVENMQFDAPSGGRAAAALWNIAHGQAADLTQDQATTWLEMATGGSYTADQATACASADEAKQAGDAASQTFFDQVIRPTIKGRSAQ